MKKLVFTLVVLTIILSACGLPSDPQYIQMYCKDEYEILLVDDPNFPPAFIGACTSALQTGKPDAFKALCGYEPFWQELFVEITSRKDCIQYLNEFEPE